MTIKNHFSDSARLAIILPVALLISTFGKAQTRSQDHYNIGIFYPISTNGRTAAADTNIFSLNLIAGVSAGEKSFTFAGLSNIIRHDAKGFQFAGFSNHLGGKSEGFLFAGFANTYGSGKGGQFAGFTNVARKEVEGAQFAGFLNKSGDIKGAQFAGFANISKQMTGSQFAGFANIAKKDVTGSQFAGFINKSADAKGSQFAGFINKASDVKGSQFAGFINIAKKVKGSQFAGFINIADSSECPVGIINIIKKGEKGIGVTTDESLTTLASFRSGGRSLYGIIGAGYNFKNNNEVYAFEAGLGGHIIFSNYFRINTELAVVMLESFDPGEYFKSSFRLMPAVKAGKHVELFAGPVFNFVSTNTREGKALTNHYIQTWDDDNNYLRGIYIGYMGGVQFFF